MQCISHKEAFRILDEVASGDRILTRSEAAQVRSRLSMLQVDLDQAKRRLDALDLAIGRP